MVENILRESITEAIKALDFAVPDFILEHPTDLSYGDYASNVALILAKEVGKSPQDLAKEIKTELEKKLPKDVEKIEIAGPGFINFHLSRDFFTSQITQINNEGDQWGASKTQQGEVILLEYTSPNLFKPLHVGNLVGNIVGESLARLFSFSGADVKRINYPSDIGLTVAKGVWGLVKTKGNPEDIEALGEAYREGNTVYEAGGDAKKEIEEVNRALYAHSDPKLDKLREKGIQTSRARIGELCRMLGTTFDKEIFESEAGPIGEKLVQENLVKGVFEESDGAVIFRGENYGLHTRVFLNSQGLPTYEAKDLGNFSLKQDSYPSWDLSIVVTGGEQREYFKVVIEAIRAVFSLGEKKRVEHIPTGFLTLTTGKMSSRKGNVLTGESLLRDLKEEAQEREDDNNRERGLELFEEVAVAALKYDILRHSVGSDIVFDKERALSFEGDSGPYLQYTHARIISVRKKAEAAGIAPSVADVPEHPYEIEKFLYQFPEVVQLSLKDRSPHHLTIFLTQLAGSFNTFYAKERIADTNDVHAPYKNALVVAVGQTLKNGLWLLGIKTPERM